MDSFSDFATKKERLVSLISSMQLRKKFDIIYATPKTKTKQNKTDFKLLYVSLTFVSHMASEH